MNIVNRSRKVKTFPWYIMHKQNIFAEIGEPARGVPFATGGHKGRTLPDRILSSDMAIINAVACWLILAQPDP